MTVSSDAILAYYIRLCKKHDDSCRSAMRAARRAGWRFNDRVFRKLWHDTKAGK